MKNLPQGAICVETRFSIESGNYDGTWFYLADYGNLAEFLIDCAGWFCDEENPEYIYQEWRDIPDCLISREWICPNIFEIRDALQSLDDKLIGAFENWCRIYGWDITTDDPYKLITDFRNSLTDYPAHNGDLTDPEDHEPDTMPEDYISYAMAFSPDIFDDNYN